MCLGCSVGFRFWVGFRVVLELFWGWLMVGLEFLQGGLRVPPFRFTFLANLILSAVHLPLPPVPLPTPSISANSGQPIATSAFPVHSDCPPVLTSLSIPLRSLPIPPPPPRTPPTPLSPFLECVVGRARSCSRLCCVRARFKLSLMLPVGETSSFRPHPREGSSPVHSSSKCIQFCIILFFLLPSRFYPFVVDVRSRSSYPRFISLSVLLCFVAGRVDSVGRVCWFGHFVRVV